jgi:hypothetical protein
MRDFSLAHPELELAVAVGNRDEVLDRVLSHSADVAISGRPPTDDRLVAMPLLLDNEIVCITAPGGIAMVDQGPGRLVVIPERLDPEAASMIEEAIWQRMHFASHLRSRRDRAGPPRRRSSPDGTARQRVPAPRPRRPRPPDRRPDAEIELRRWVAGSV